MTDDPEIVILSFDFIQFFLFFSPFLIGIINHNAENKTLIRYLSIIVRTKRFKKFIIDSNWTTIVFIVSIYYSLRIVWGKQFKVQTKRGRFAMFNEIRWWDLSPSENLPTDKGNEIGIVEKRRIYLGSRSTRSTNVNDLSPNSNGHH